MSYDGVRFVVEAVVVSEEPRMSDDGWWTPMAVELRLASFEGAVVARAPMDRNDCRYIEYQGGGAEQVAAIVAKTLKAHFDGLGKMAVLA